MTTILRKSNTPALTLLPQPDQRFFIGVDIAKNSHVAGFVSPALLNEHRRFTKCPTFSFANSRLGFESLVNEVKHYVALESCVVLVEHTGHYGSALKQYLQEQGIEIYEMHASKRMSKEKTDKRDALNLANILYSQLDLGVQILDEKQRVYRLLPSDEVATTLRTLMQWRYKLERDITRHRNKLTAIVDEIFPELVEIIADPNGTTALRIRAAYPTPANIATANIEDLKALRAGTLPGNAKLAKLQALATQSIGTKNQGRITGLVTEQRQLIDELVILEAHCAEIDVQIMQIVATSRQGKILLSLPGIAEISAAEIIASIGNIANFERASKLRGYFGWSPVRTQTGETKDSTKLDQGGRRPIKKAMYLIVWRATKDDTEFRDLYERLVKSRCAYDPIKNDYVGKNKVIGRVVGQYISVIYALLRKDYDLLASLADGEEAPPPALYDAELHRSHRRRGGTSKR